ncbi:MAG: VanZ family protein [Bacteroidia bacterium]
MFKFIYRYCVLLSIVWILIIFILCATPGQYIPSASWLEMLSFDKWVHASIFFILTSLFLTIAVKKKQGWPVIMLYIILCIAYGGLLEIMQAKFFSNRSADWQDFVANSFGVLVAFALLKKIKAVYGPFF